jgi:hypothetical protein
VDRSSSEVLALRVPLVAEMAAGDLGDRRLNARRDRLIATLEQHPDAGFPEACADDSEAEALYRFLRNDRLSLESLLGPHVVATAARCQALEEVLVVHDTTEMSFGGERARMGLTAVGPRHQAFWLHASLAVSAEGLRAPLGVIALAPFTRGAAPGPAPTWRERYDDAAKESRRWTTGVRAVRERCGPTVQVIHVMDREGDSYELFTELLAADERFVVRLAHDRRLTSRDDGSPEKLGAALAQASICFEQTVEVAARRGARPPQARKKHPPRAQRAAHLRIAARQVTFSAPRGPAGLRPAAGAHRECRAGVGGGPAGGSRAHRMAVGHHRADCHRHTGNAGHRLVPHPLVDRRIFQVREDRLRL